MVRDERGIHLVARVRSSKVPTGPGIIHLTHGNYYADIVRDRRDLNVWIYVVQREASTDVLAMGSCHSEQAAREVATHRMRELAAADDGNATAAIAI